MVDVAATSPKEPTLICNGRARTLRTVFDYSQVMPVCETNYLDHVYCLSGSSGTYIALVFLEIACLILDTLINKGLFHQVDDLYLKAKFREEIRWCDWGHQNFTAGRCNASTATRRATVRSK